MALRMRIGLVALASVACGPSVGAGDGTASSTAAEATDAADITGVMVTSSTADEGSTGEPPTLCLTTVTIVLDTTDAYVGFADVDGDDRPELWRHVTLGRPGHDGMLLDAFRVEVDGSTIALATDQIEGSFPQYADVDGDGRDDLITRPDLEGAQSWQRGQADLTFALPQAISLADFSLQSWLDVDGDGDADVFGSQETQQGSLDASVTLSLGDGTGDFTSAGTLEFPIGAWIHPVVPTPEPGVFIASDYNGSDGFGAASSFWRIEVAARGVPSLVAGTPELSHEVLVAANDFDGDGVTDLLTHQVESDHELRLWTADGDGYVERTVAVDVLPLAVGALLGDGGVQLLFGDPAGKLWLLPTPFVEGAEPLAVEGMLTGNEDRVIDLGDDGQDEVVSRTQDDEGISEYAMHDVVPCG